MHQPTNFNGKTSGSTGNGRLVELNIPQNPEAEEAVLGSLLIDRDLIATVASMLKPQHFFNQDRANVYQAILNLYSTGIPADLITVRDELKAMQLLGNEPGQIKGSYLLRLMEATPTPVHVQYYADIVLNYWLARRLISEGSNLVASSYQGQLESNKILADFVERLQNLSVLVRGRESPYFTSHEKSLDHFVTLATDVDEKREEKVQTSSAANVKLPRPRFGWADFDGRDWAESPVLSLLPSTLTTILGRTGGGKTLIASQIADTNAVAGLNVLYFHVELNSEQMLARRYCRLTAIPILSQLRRTLSDQDLQLLSTASGEISGWPGRVDFIHCPEWTVEHLIQELKARQCALAVKTGRGYDLVVLDYLQRLGWPKGSNSEREALASNVRRFSDCLNEMNLAGLMTSQVGRSDARQYEPPDLDEGLGTGEIERCSNQLLALAISQDKTLGKYVIRKNTFAESDISGALIFDAKRLRFL
jgi:replicative DNA helicase